MPKPIRKQTVSKLEWFDKHQKFEKDWWGNCLNTFGEEIKQITYAEKMGLKWTSEMGKKVIDAQNKTILDVGGGAVSLLLKCINLKHGVVVEPMELPPLMVYRYAYADITLSQQPAEEMDLTGKPFDEVWLYNVLQHTYDPATILKKIKAGSKLIRIFEWLDTPKHDGHPITLTKEFLDEHLGGEGRVEGLDESEWGGFNKAYYGVFLGDHYDGETNL